MHTARLFFRGLFIPTLAVFFLLFLTTGKTYAQTQTYYPPAQINQYLAPNTNPNVPHNQHTFVQSVVIESLATGMCLLSGYDVLNPTHQCLGIDPNTHKLGLAPVSKTSDGRPVAGGAIGGMSSMIGTLYAYQPASSIKYVHYMADNFGFGEKAYAQQGGGGYENLYDLRLLWREFRNVSYGIMVIAFVIIGILIMLRVRIDPRTVMTVQNQIPKIIIGILLITFSYAIAGFMVDIMWFATYFGINAVASTDTVVQQATGNILNSPISFVSRVFTGSGDGGMWDLAQSIGDSLAGIVVTQFGKTGDCGVSFFGLGGGSLTNCFFDFIDWLGGLILTLIVLAAILISLVRIWFTLLKAYAYIILDVIAAPLWIAAGAIPGSSLNFSSWFRHITAHLLLFPAVTTMIVLARTLQERFCPDLTDASCKAAHGDLSNFFVPPLIGNPGGKVAFINLIVLSILLMLPEMLTILRDALRSKPLPYTAAVGAGVAAGAGLIGGVIGGGFRAGLAAKVKSPEMGKPAGWRGALRQTVRF